MRQGIRFYLGSERIDLTRFDPQMTVLEWLRGPAFRTGTKEGCAEGDCGACSVLVGRLHGGRVRYRAINACIQPLATLDGCHVITVEDLSLPDGSLHPVQEALVECHGSQCGYCTPGFVMSLLALYHEREDLAHWSLLDVLAGNLCRCTGYGPILQAAQQALADEALVSHPFDPNMAACLQELQHDSGFLVDDGDRRFYAPVSLDQLLQLRADYPEATIIAGATDTGLWVTKQHRDLGVQIWLGRVAELDRITETESDITIGAGVSYNDSMAAVKAYHGDGAELWRRIGSVQIRNAGTIGGNIANGSPIGDTPPLLIAAGAQLRLKSLNAERTIPLEDFFLDYGKQDLQTGEIVAAIVVPKLSANWRFRAYKISKRFDQDISAVCAAFCIHIEDGVVKGARIAFGGMAATPRRASQTETYLVGRSWSRDEVEIAMATLARDFTPISDMRSSADYRLKVARNLLLKCFIETTSAERLRLAGEVADAA